MPKSNPVTPNKQPPENWNELVAEFVRKAGRGLTKTFIKKLWTVEEDLMANANPSVLRMMYCSPALLICQEGVKLVAKILTKIEVVNGLTLLEKQISKGELSDTECERYGGVFVTAWVNASEDSRNDITEELKTEVFHVFCQHALYAHKPICVKFQKVLVAFANEKKVHKGFEAMITSILNGCIFHALDAPNWIVQSSAAEVFFRFFPLVTGDALEDEELLEKQLRYTLDLLKSDIVSIRTDAARRVFKVLSDFWIVLPRQKTREIANQAIDILSKDTVVGVRVAVFEGINSIVFEPNCLTIYQNAMKCASPSGVLDKADRVRLAAYQALTRLKAHKFISIFDILDRDEIIAMLELENVEDCRKTLVPIMQAILPMSEDMDEKYYRPRIDYILGKSRISLLTYFRLLAQMKIIEASQAAKLIEMLIIWSYRYLRRKDGPPLPETEDKYRKARSYLECALILYMSCKKMLTHDLVDGKMKGRCDQLFGKVVKEIFEKYANTPILGTATAISSVIPTEYLKTIASDVLAQLADDEVPPEALEPFVESALHFRPEYIFESISEGCDVLVDLYGEKKKQSKKKKRDVGTPDEVLTTALNRLRYIVQSYSTSCLLAKEIIYKDKALELVKKIDLIREAIEVRLIKEENDEHALRDETILLALEFRFILPIYAVSESSDDDNERTSIITSIKTLLNWFQDKIADKIDTFQEHNQEFFIKMSTTFLNCLNVILSAYDFKTRPLEYEDEEDEENKSPEDQEKEKEDETTVGTIVGRIVRSFCNSDTPCEVLVPALRVGATLCEDSYDETHALMAELLRFIPKWLNKQCNTDEEEEDVEHCPEQDTEVATTIRQFHKRVSETAFWDEKNAVTMVQHFSTFAFIGVSIDDEEYEDPRREDYQPPRFISIAFVKFILKDKSLTEDLLNEIWKNYFSDNMEVYKDNGELTTNSQLSVLALLSHVLRILERYSKSHINRIREGIQTCTTKVLDCFASATDLNTVDNHIMNSLSSLLDVQLPDDF